MDERATRRTGTPSDLNRALVSAFHAARESGEADRIAAHLTSDAEWWMPRSLMNAPIRGDALVAALAGGIAAQVFDPATMQRRIDRIVADGEIVVVEQTVTARTHAGVDYENRYCWVYTCRDGRIARIVEHADTLTLARALGAA